MKKQIILMAAAGVMLATSCSKLAPLTQENFSVNPTPLEATAGKVPATINVTFPAKYMKKKAVITMTPTLKFNGGEVQGQSVTYQGEKIEGNATPISYKNGGNGVLKNTWNYTEDMLKSDLCMQFDAKLGKKTVSLPEVKIGYGVLATSALLGQCLDNTNASVAPDAFERVIQQKKEANIKFLIAQSKLRASETGSISMKELVAILKEINDNEETRALNAIEVSAYASPDGKFSFNEQLAEKRQNVSTTFLSEELKKIKMAADINMKFTAEDWDGFQELVSQSNLQDKAIILRVLSMYSDPEEREKQIMNMSAIYTDIKEGILPELRRARLIVNYSVIGRSDEQIVNQFKSDASQLSVEEMLYGANMLMENAADKEAWLQKTAQIYGSDYRALNNLAQLAYTKGDLATAQQYLQKAANINSNAAQVNTNLALIALNQGNVEQAEMLLAKGSGAEGFNEVQGALNIAKGNYPQAAANMKGVNSNAAALAQILAQDYVSAKETLNNIKNETANTYYLKAILAARMDDLGGIANNIRKVAQQNPSLAKRAINDLEFAKYTSTINSLVK